MKTLDEVIFEAPYTPTPWGADALHYLKDYRMLVNDIAEKRQELEDEKTRYQEAVKNCEEAENKFRKMEDELNDIRREHIEQMKNPSLTWDELKAMKGKPVWVQCSGADGNWFIVEDFGSSGEAAFYVILSGNQYFEYDMRDRDDGVSWQAYRKERV